MAQVRDCTFGDSHATVQDNVGVYLKTERGRGGYIRDLLLERLTFAGAGVTQPFWWSMHYSDARPPTNASATPRLSNLTLRQIHITTATGKARGNKGWAGAFVGLPEAPIEGVTLTDVSVSVPRGVKPPAKVAAWDCEHVKGVVAHGVEPPLPVSCYA